MNRDEIEKLLRQQFEAELQDRIDRYERSRKHNLIPLDFFSAASSECRRLFISGEFYACITLAQSVAEGLAKYIAEKNSRPIIKDYHSQIGHLHNPRNGAVISPATYQEFKAIHGDDRNDFHHLNREVEQDYRQLEARATECLESLFSIESALFEYELIEGGKICPINPQYWPTDPDEPSLLFVYARFD